MRALPGNILVSGIILTGLYFVDVPIFIIGFIAMFLSATIFYGVKYGRS